MKRLKKPHAAGLLALLFALALGAGWAQESATLPATVDPDEAVIDLGMDETVTQQEFAQEFDRAMRALALQQGLPYNTETRALFDRFRADFLNQYATQRALLREADSRGITVTDEELDQQIQKAQGALGGEEAFQQAIQDLGYMSVDEYREVAREGLLAQRLVDELRTDVDISDEQVQTFYDENQAELFQDRPLEEVRPEVEARLMSQELNQRFQEIREAQGIQTYPERLSVNETETE
jgi:parvulin-like peptidyl-prolyl isomerase